MMDVAREIGRTAFWYERCQELFTMYPLAADPVDEGGSIQSMVLVLREDDEARYFVLSRNHGDGVSRFSLCQWPAGAVVGIEVSASLPVPAAFEGALTRGVPIPKEGSLLGWTHGDSIAALIAVYTEYTPASPEPCWSVMPLAGVPEAQWPPFTGEPLIGDSFWELLDVGKIVSVGDLVARTPCTVFWVDTDAILGSGCCVVARDIESPEGYTLRGGCYIYYKVLRAGNPVPPLQVLLSGTGKTDLAARFE